MQFLLPLSFFSVSCCRRCSSLCEVEVASLESVHDTSHPCDDAGKFDIFPSSRERSRAIIGGRRTRSSCLMGFFHVIKFYSRFAYLFPPKKYRNECRARIRRKHSVPAHTHKILFISYNMLDVIRRMSGEKTILRLQKMLVGKLNVRVDVWMASVGWCELEVAFISSFLLRHESFLLLSTDCRRQKVSEQSGTHTRPSKHFGIYWRVI